LEKENQERRAKEDLLRELAIKMGLPVTLVPSSTTSTTTATTTTTTTESTQNDVMVMGHLFNQTRYQILFIFCQISLLLRLFACLMKIFCYEM
jgi:hypothetical protein